VPVERRGKEPFKKSNKRKNFERKKGRKKEPERDRNGKQRFKKSNNKKRGRNS